MAELFELTSFFAPAVIAANWTEDPSNREQYYLQSLFTPWKKQGLDLSWIKGSRGIPISLMPSAFDAQATFRDRIGFELTETEMPFFREGFKIKEKDRQELLKIRDADEANVSNIVDRLFDDYNDLIEGARVVKERELAQLLFPVDGDAGIVFKANGVDYSYNYDKDGTWKTNNYFPLTGTALWTASSTADPFNDIDTAKNAVYAETGTEPNILIMNNTTLNLLTKMDSVKNRFLTVNGLAVGYITREDVIRLIEATCGVQIVIYNKKYRDESKISHNFVPDGYVSMIPGGAPLGRLAQGTTPEEADLRGRTDASVAIVDTGIAITQIVEKHPVNVNTIASMIALPTFERMDECALLKVTA